jgi:hypothetical protein
LREDARAGVHHGAQRTDGQRRSGKAQPRRQRGAEASRQTQKARGRRGQRTGSAQRRTGRDHRRDDQDHQDQDRHQLLPPPLLFGDGADLGAGAADDFASAAGLRTMAATMCADTFAAMLVSDEPSGVPMNAVVIEHVPVADLPRAWRDKLAPAADARVTVRIETEGAVAQSPAAELADDPLFGMWRDRSDMADVSAYIRSIRASRFNDDDSRGGS